MESDSSKSFSDFVFYADESGDHSLTTVDEGYPVFALALCAFDKKAYSHRIVPRFQELKFRHFGHDAVVLHERDIRKQIGEFAKFNDKSSRENFLHEVSELMRNSAFCIFSTVIDKRKIKQDFFPDHPYHISLRFCLEAASRFLERRKQNNSITHFIFERRGKKEDDDLELAFRQIVQGDNIQRLPMPHFRIIFADKKINSTGMQIADLVARPIGLHIFKPDQENKAYNIIKEKFVKTNNSHSVALRSRGIHIL